MDESIGQMKDNASGCDSEERRPVISFQRRKELLRFAETLAEQVLEKTKSHERCFLRQAVTSLVERD